MKEYLVLIPNECYRTIYADSFYIHESNSTVHFLNGELEVAVFILQNIIGVTQNVSAPVIQKEAK